MPLRNFPASCFWHGVFRRTSATIGLLVVVNGSAAQTAPSAPQPFIEQQRQRDRERALREQQERAVDVRLPTTPERATGRLPESEAPCFRIDRLVLDGERADDFQWLLPEAAGAQNDDSPLGRCLGTQGVNTVIERLQQALIARGWVTSRVLAAPQDLASGTLRLTLVPGRIAAIRFAEGTTDRTSLRTAIPATVGGNLNIQSLQDRTEYESKQSSGGFDVSICVPPICYGQYVTASANYAKQSVDHNYQSATGQSGIAAGSGGFDITVNGNTDLKGGAITSTAPIDKNSFTTGSLTTSDLTNRQNTDSRSESLSVSYGSAASMATNVATSVTNTALGNLNSGKGLPSDKNETSQTLSVISPSNVKITGTGNAEVDAKTAENVATLTSRDAATANGALVNNLTLQQAQDIPRQQQEAADRQRAAQLVGSVIDNVIGDVSAKNGWAEGGAAKIALHGLAGIVQAKIGDGSALAGAAAGMANEALLPVMTEYLESQGTAADLARGASMNNGDCPGCWRAKAADGTWVIYRPAGKASADTIPTTATVEINSPDVNLLNSRADGRSTVLKLKFPLTDATGAAK